MTEPVTARRGDGEYFGSWHVVDDWFFLDRIDVPCDHFSVDEKLEFSSDVLSDAAKSHLSFWDVAVSSACCASDP